MSTKLAFFSALFSLIFFSNISFANQNFLPIPLINRDDKLLKITKANFQIVNTAPNLKATFVSEVKWERTKQNLLLPFLKMRFKTDNDQRAHLHYRYKDVTYLPQIRDDEEFTDLDYSVFDPVKVEVFHEGTKVGEISVKSLSENMEKTVLIDYSCSGYNLQISGFDGNFLSVGCEILRENVDGEVLPTLNVNWISSEFRTLDLHHGPYVISFSEGRDARVKVRNEIGDTKEIHFKVNFPKRLHRFRIAGGLGPYMYKTSNQDQEKNSEMLPSLMLYGNYYLNNIHSLKFFEALVVKKESFFNHAGMYLGSDIGKFYDDRLVISTLVGFQEISHQFDGKDNAFTQVIFPQGIELALHHPFAMENYRFTLGGFVSPQPGIIYQNFWARFGSKVFLEFNYINWAYRERAASMYGLSIGFPLAQMF